MSEKTSKGAARSWFRSSISSTGGSSLLSILVGCFSAFGGMLMGYDTGTISGILAMDYVLERFPRNDAGTFTSTENALIVSILSLGTFVGAVITSPISDTLGRKLSVIIGTLFIFNFGIILQTCATAIPLLVAGRFFAGMGIGVIAAVIPLYQSETVPRAIRGFIVSLYQFAFAFGLVLATIIVNATHNRDDSGSYRIPIAVQFIWALILGVGFCFLPETPRFYITKSERERALKSLSVLRMLPVDDARVIEEYDEIKANYDYEVELSHDNDNESHIYDGFRAVFSTNGRQLSRLFTGITIQVFQQLTGINFIFYYGVTFFKNAGIKNSFVVSIACNVINCAMTIPGAIGVEIFGRRPILLIGSMGMCISDFIISITAVASKDNNDTTNKVMIAFICIFIAFFGLSFGPGVWVVCGEIFPLKIRAKSFSLATGANWLSNFAIAYGTPYLVDSGPGNANLGAKVYFIWGGCNLAAFLFVFFFVYETKNLKLEEIDELYTNVKFAWKSGSYNKMIQRRRKETHFDDPEVSAINGTLQNDKKDNGFKETMKVIC